MYILKIKYGNKTYKSNIMSEKLSKKVFIHHLQTVIDSIINAQSEPSSFDDFVLQYPADKKAKKALSAQADKAIKQKNKLREELFNSLEWSLEYKKPASN